MRRFILFLALSGLCGLRAHALDVNSDVEDLTAESDAAVAETKDVKAHMAQEKADAEKAHQAAASNYSTAASKRQQAVEAMNRSEKEIQTMTADQSRLKGEVEKINKETADAQKVVQENAAKAEKIKGENQALEDLKKEKTAKIAELNAQRDKMILEMRDLDDQKALADRDFQKLRGEEKTVQEQHDKSNQELTQKKAYTQAYITSLKERPLQASAASAATTPTTPVAEGATTAAAAGTETAPASMPAQPEIQRAVSSTPPEGGDVATGIEMTLKKDCKIYDKPTKGLKVVGVKFSGTTVVKSEEGSNWIAFKMSDGQKGFASKTCF